MSPRKVALFAAIAAAACLAAPFAQAQDKDQRSNLSSGERKFLMSAAQHNMAEVEIGKMAESKAASPDARKFGQQMVQDHSKALDDVSQIAKAKSVSLPTEPDRAHKNEMRNLEKLSGANFDRKYMDSMVRDHQKDVKEFRKISKNAKDPDVRAHAEKTLPVLEGHLQMARQVASSTSPGAKR